MLFGGLFDIWYCLAMSIRKDILVEGEYYHIYNRGNNKRDIFLDDQDKDRFVKLLYLCNSKRNIRFREDIVNEKINAWDFDKGQPIISIGAWVLMPNHFHLYVTIPPRRVLGYYKEMEENPISVFMKKICTGYSMYFNKKYERTGTLFEGPFKSVHIKNDQQAKYIFSYIHLNPVKLIDPLWKERGLKNTKKTMDFLQSYYWNSYLDYYNKKRSEHKIISQKDFPDYFSNKDLFDEEIFGWFRLET